MGRRAPRSIGGDVHFIEVETLSWEGSLILKGRLKGKNANVVMKLPTSSTHSLINGLRRALAMQAENIADLQDTMRTAWQKPQS